jgi:hypothetical protein
VAGATQREIATALGISQAAVSKILARADARLLQEQHDLGLRVKARQTMQLEHIRTEAMAAWHASKADATRRRQRRTDGTGGSTGGVTSVAEVITEAQCGDPRYLAEARGAMSDVRKLWGLDAPQQLQIDARNPYANLTDEQLAREAQRQQALLPRPEEMSVIEHSLSSTVEEPSAAVPK